MNLLISIIIIGSAFSTVTDDEKQEFLDAHNLFRCMHGSPALEWDDTMYTNVEETFGQSESLPAHSDSYNNNDD